MQRNVKGLWAVRCVTFAVAGLAAWCATYWVLKSWSTTAAAAPLATAAPAAAVDPEAVARALGGGVVAQATAAAEAPANSRFVLTGVLADTVRGGAALIAVDGKPAKPYRVGAAVEGGWVLQSVAGRRAVLAQASGAAAAGAAADVALELPPLPR